MNWRSVPEPLLAIAVVALIIGAHVLAEAIAWMPLAW